MRPRDNIKEASAHLRRAFEALGLDCTSADTQDTPTRVAKYWAELARNQGKKPKLTRKAVYDPNKAIKLTLFDTVHVDGLIIERDLAFSSVCAHHMLPFYGRATIGYLPDKAIIGASKIPRLLDYFANRPQTQEYLTQEIADYLKELTGAQFVGVILIGTHTCCSCRGARKPGMQMVTSCLRPSNRQDLKSEFLALSGH